MSTDPEWVRKAMILIVIVVVGITAMWSIIWLTTPVTPTILMTYQHTGGPWNQKDNYTFTVVFVTSNGIGNEVKWSNLVVKQIGSTTQATVTMPSTGMVGAGDQIILTGLAADTMYTIVLVFVPSGGGAYQVSFMTT